MSVPPVNDEDPVIDLRPVRWRGRLAFWLTVSVVFHLVAGTVLWQSQAVRDFLFSSFRSHQPEFADLEAMRRARSVYDQLVRKRMVDANKKMLMISKQVMDKRDQEWNGVVERAAVNPNFKEMKDGGLPKFDLIDSPGKSATEDILVLYDRACRIEGQVFTLYEHFKAVNLSLISVSGTKDGQPVPQALADSLSLVALERPERRELDKALLLASDEALFAIKAIPAVPGTPETGPVPAQPDGFQRWKKEVTNALELCEVMANNCQRILENVNKPGLFIDSGFASLTAAAGGEGWTDGTNYLGESLRPQDTADSELTTIDPNAVMTFGKSLGSVETSKPAKYLVVDTWWSIGPFDYIGGIRTAESLQHRYPPENGVDLDATYVGKEGRKLKWEYHPMSSVKQLPRFVQRRSLWYFYTEFWSDKDQEVWANIATDDYGAVWLNDRTDPVYTSGIDPRPWIVLDAKQYVKLKIRRGTNRMLLKLDNNGGLTGFTFLFHLR